MEIDKLTLMAGVSIPVPQLRVNIHQPIIREIAIIGEERFYRALGYFRIGREVLEQNIRGSIPETEGAELDIEGLVKSALGNITDFEVFMQVINDPKSNPPGVNMKEDVRTILTLLMPEYFFDFEERFIIGICPPNESIRITDEEFKQIKEIITTIFCLNTVRADEFNPEGDRAKAIAAKLLAAREKVKKLKGETGEKKESILSNYLSSLGIGTHSLNLLNARELTVYQLFDQMQRLGLKMQHDHGIDAMMAGAKDVELVDWLQSL